MKICHVSSCFVPSHGGVETFIYQLCKKQVQKGHKVKVITSDRGQVRNKNHEWIDEIEVTRYPERYHLFEAPIMPRIALRVLSEDYDILHIHGMVPTVSDLSLILGKLKRKPIVLTYHCDAETPEYGLIGKLAGKGYAIASLLAVRLADRIVATTKNYARTSIVLNHVLENMTIIPCGVDKSRFSPNHGDKRGKKIAERTNNHKILYVGKLIHYKGVDVLIKAFKIVLAKSSQNCSLLIAGSGGERDELINLVKDLDLCDHVTFSGGLPDDLLPQCYRSSNLFVLPSLASRREAFGIVLLEAMASGLPVITSDIPGPDEVVRNGETGLLVPPGNVEKLAEAIITLLDDKYSSKMGICAHKDVAKKYDWSVVAESYERLYRRLAC
jgi:glycosyltransferase involved in cell wall biosynthesis